MRTIRIKRRNKLPPYRTRGCPLTKNRSPMCFGLCVPHGLCGHCGRIAPHALLGRTQLAIRESLTRR